MWFQAPIAWVTLAALAVPIVIHLVGRRPTRRQPFPTLQFLDVSRVVRVRRQRLTDIRRLLLRCAIIAAAAVALTQPLWRPDQRIPPAAPVVSRAIVIDASPGMSRLTAAQEPGIVAARRDAARLGVEATVTRTLEAGSLRTAIEGAVAWLETQGGRRELVVLSDFQPRALQRDDLRAIPDGIGLRFHRVDALTPAPAAAGVPIRLLGGAADQAIPDAARRAAIAMGAPPTVALPRPVAIVFAGYDDRAALLARARPIDAPWMFDALAAIVAELDTLDVPGPRPDAVVAAIDGVEHLTFVHHGRDPAAAAATVLATATAANSAAPPRPEFVPAARPDDELRAWERDAVTPTDSPRGASPLSDGRWFWLAALLLVLAEWRWRGPHGDAEVAKETDVRAA